MKRSIIMLASALLCAATSGCVVAPIGPAYPGYYEQPAPYAVQPAYQYYYAPGYAPGYYRHGYYRY